MPVRRRRRRQPTPGDLPRETQAVEPQRVVLAEPGRKHVGFPGTRGHFVAIEQLEHRAEPFRSLGPGVRCDALPPQQEPHEVRRRDRLDLLAQPVERVAMDAGEQTALAPLQLRHAGREPAT